MVKKILKLVLLTLLLVFVGIQFFDPGYRYPTSVPGESLFDVENVPADISKMLTTSCADCHSNETRYPWYSRIAPMSWSMADHIMVGRDDLNFSIWKTYTDSKKSRKLKQMCEEVTEGRMPHNQYLWLHREAVLSEKDKENLCIWTESTRNKIKTERTPE